MDETAFPILLVDLAYRKGALTDEQVANLWPMVRKAGGYLVANGPVTQQDRWEEDPGYSPFTLAVEIAALLAAADLTQMQDQPDAARLLREVADAWNASIESWTYVTDTDLALKIGVEGYYVRIAPPEETDSSSPLGGFVPIKNRPPGVNQAPASRIVSPDALALVRFGLRSPADPRILNTVKVIDSLLKVDLPAGPTWRRYNEDGYGEHQDGQPFDGNGIGRVWPLLTGERAHYELAAGKVETAKSLLKTLRLLSNADGLLPEQSWDGPDLPQQELYFGQPTGSAMPLVWAHAEYLKLCRSLADGQVFDMPPQAAERYAQTPQNVWTIWANSHKIRSMSEGSKLRLVLPSPALICWTWDNWENQEQTYAKASDLEIYFADLPTSPNKAGSQIRFKIKAEGTGQDSREYKIDIT